MFSSKTPGYDMGFRGPFPVSQSSMAGFGNSSNNPDEERRLKASQESDLAAKKAQEDLNRRLAEMDRIRAAREKDPLRMASDALAFGTSIAAVYHGYKRNNGSIGWALAWGIIGSAWPISIPIMLAQGFGKPAKPSAE